MQREEQLRFLKILGLLAISAVYLTGIFILIARHGVATLCCGAFIFGIFLLGKNSRLL